MDWQLARSIHCSGGEQSTYSCCDYLRLCTVKPSIMQLAHSARVGLINLVLHHSLHANVNQYVQYSCTCAFGMKPLDTKPVTLFHTHIILIKDVSQTSMSTTAWSDAILYTQIVHLVPGFLAVIQRWPLRGGVPLYIDVYLDLRSRINKIDLHVLCSLFYVLG